MNPGRYPIDTSTPVGQLRHTVGDRSATEYEGAPEGFRSYAVWPDASLEVALLQSGGNAFRAAGLLYSQLATQYAQAGRLSVKADDLSLAVQGSASSDIAEIAKTFFEQANQADAAAANDIFIVAPLARRGRRSSLIPAATPTDDDIDGGTP